MIEDLPAASFLLADRAYSSAAFPQALIERGITPCILPHAKHRVQHSYDPVLYRQRHKIENLFARFRASQDLVVVDVDRPDVKTQPHAVGGRRGGDPREISRP